MNSVLRILVQRIGLGILTLFIVSIVIFGSVNLLPGDFAQAILGQGATDEAVAAIREQIGLTKPFWVRYFDWLGALVTGDLGVSYSQLMFAANMGGDQLIPITTQIAPRFYNTMFLAGLTAMIAVPFSLFLGVLAALYRGSVFDRGANIFTLSSISSPEFFLAYILILFLAVQGQWLPSLASVKPDMPLGERVYTTLLPALTLTLVVTAHMMRMTRAAIINLLASPYIEMARLKGISPMRVVVKHALPNALAPIINVIALNLAYLITGVVVVEVVFAYPGIGNLFVDAVRTRDIPMVQICCLIFAAAYILLNLTADVLSILSNPRLRHPK
ncbi:ABC transporter permease [Pseudaestuariivita atlantica]|uniref:ABC transporter permease n=1 Tax=Pseudaestuariivita atlantica TaxID=1317121 RepID=A0A0L1JQH0_9RHOB|nr:ABC transporter permease [Pseudaestuariivita atlantica]KNG93668.1 ABC transporter permease [Pseudaestuariivita atlantica]